MEYEYNHERTLSPRPRSQLSSEYSGASTAHPVEWQDDWIHREEEFKDTINALQSEQERIQKKTFTNWINSHVEHHRDHWHVKDLFTDLKDGRILLALIEVITSDHLPCETFRNYTRAHYLSNVERALDYLRDRNIKLVNINSSDVVDGNETVILGLIWSIILNFQIDQDLAHLRENFMLSPLPSGLHSGSYDSRSRSVSPSPAKKPRLASRGRFQAGASKAMLKWCQKEISDPYGIVIVNLSSSWKDGMAFLGLVKVLDPNLVNLNDYRTATPAERMSAAFTLARDRLGIAKLLDVADIDVDRPDERSIMTYIAQFIKRFPEVKRNRQKMLMDNLPDLDTLEANEKAEYERIRDWCTDILTVFKCMELTEDRPYEIYEEYQKFQVNFRTNIYAYSRLKERFEEGRTLHITEQDITELDSVWARLISEKQIWHRHLFEVLEGHERQFCMKLDKIEAELDQRVLLPPQQYTHFSKTNLEFRVQKHEDVLATLVVLRDEVDAYLLQEYPSEIFALHNLPSEVNSLIINLERRLLEERCKLLIKRQLVVVDEWERRVLRWQEFLLPPGNNMERLHYEFELHVVQERIFDKFLDMSKQLQYCLERLQEDVDADKHQRAEFLTSAVNSTRRWKRVAEELHAIREQIREWRANQKGKGSQMEFQTPTKEKSTTQKPLSPTSTISPPIHLKSERWLRYTEKVAVFSRWVDRMERDFESIDREEVNRVEYQQGLQRFRALCNEVLEHKSDGQEIIDTFYASSAELPPSIVSEERRKINRLIRRYDALIPSLEIVRSEVEHTTHSHQLTESNKETVQLVPDRPDSSKDLLLRVVTPAGGALSPTMSVGTSGYATPEFENPLLRRSEPTTPSESFNRSPPFAHGISSQSSMNEGSPVEQVFVRDVDVDDHDSRRSPGGAAARKAPSEERHYVRNIRIAEESTPRSGPSVAQKPKVMFSSSAERRVDSSGDEDDGAKKYKTAAGYVKLRPVGKTASTEELSQTTMTQHSHRTTRTTPTAAEGASKISALRAAFEPSRAESSTTAKPTSMKKTSVYDTLRRKSRSSSSSSTDNSTSDEQKDNIPGVGTKKTKKAKRENLATPSKDFSTFVRDADENSARARNVEQRQRPTGIVFESTVSDADIDRLMRESPSSPPTSAEKQKYIRNIKTTTLITSKEVKTVRTIVAKTPPPEDTIPYVGSGRLVGKIKPAAAFTEVIVEEAKTPVSVGKIKQPAVFTSPSQSSSATETNVRQVEEDVPQGHVKSQVAELRRRHESDTTGSLSSSDTEALTKKVTEPKKSSPFGFLKGKKQTKTEFEETSQVVKRVVVSPVPSRSTTVFQSTPPTVVRDVTPISPPVTTPTVVRDVEPFEKPVPLRTSSEEPSGFQQKILVVPYGTPKTPAEEAPRRVNPMVDLFERGKSDPTLFAQKPEDEALTITQIRTDSPLSHVSSTPPIQLYVEREETYRLRPNGDPSYFSDEAQQSPTQNVSQTIRSFEEIFAPLNAEPAKFPETPTTPRSRVSETQPTTPTESYVRDISVTSSVARQPQPERMESSSVITSAMEEKPKKKSSLFGGLFKSKNKVSPVSPTSDLEISPRQKPDTEVTTTRVRDNGYQVLHPVGVSDDFRTPGERMETEEAETYVRPAEYVRLPERDETSTFVRPADVPHHITFSDDDIERRVSLAHLLQSCEEPEPSMVSVSRFETSLPADVQSFLGHSNVVPVAQDTQTFVRDVPQSTVDIRHRGPAVIHRVGSPDANMFVGSETLVRDDIPERPRSPKPKTVVSEFEEVRTDHLPSTVAYVSRVHSDKIATEIRETPGATAVIRVRDAEIDSETAQKRIRSETPVRQLSSEIAVPHSGWHLQSAGRIFHKTGIKDESYETQNPRFPGSEEDTRTVVPVETPENVRGVRFSEDTNIAPPQHEHVEPLKRKDEKIQHFISLTDRGFESKVFPRRASRASQENLLAQQDEAVAVRGKIKLFDKLVETNAGIEYGRSAEMRVQELASVASESRSSRSVSVASSVSNTPQPDVDRKRGFFERLSSRDSTTSQKDDSQPRKKITILETLGVKSTQPKNADKSVLQMESVSSSVTRERPLSTTVREEERVQMSRSEPRKIRHTTQGPRDYYIASEFEEPALTRAPGDQETTRFVEHRSPTGEPLLSRPRHIRRFSGPNDFFIASEESEIIMNPKERPVAMETVVETLLPRTDSQEPELMDSGEWNTSEFVEESVVKHKHDSSGHLVKTTTGFRGPSEHMVETMVERVTSPTRNRSGPRDDTFGYLQDQSSIHVRPADIVRHRSGPRDHYVASDFDSRESIREPVSRTHGVGSVHPEQSHVAESVMEDSSQEHSPHVRHHSGHRDNYFVSQQISTGSPVHVLSPRKTETSETHAAVPQPSIHLRSMDRIRHRTGPRDHYVASDFGSTDDRESLREHVSRTHEHPSVVRDLSGYIVTQQPFEGSPIFDGFESVGHHRPQEHLTETFVRSSSPAEELSHVAYELDKVARRMSDVAESFSPERRRSSISRRDVERFSPPPEQSPPPYSEYARPRSMDDVEEFSSVENRDDRPILSRDVTDVRDLPTVVSTPKGRALLSSEYEEMTVIKTTTNSARHPMVTQTPTVVRESGEKLSPIERRGDLIEEETSRSRGPGVVHRIGGSDMDIVETSVGDSEPSVPLAGLTKIERVRMGHIPSSLTETSQKRFRLEKPNQESATSPSDAEDGDLESQRAFWGSSGIQPSPLARGAHVRHLVGIKDDTFERFVERPPINQEFGRETVTKSTISGSPANLLGVSKSASSSSVDSVSGVGITKTVRSVSSGLPVTMAEISSSDRSRDSSPEGSRRTVGTIVRQDPKAAKVITTMSAEQLPHHHVGISDRNVETFVTSPPLAEERAGSKSPIQEKVEFAKITLVRDVPERPVRRTLPKTIEIFSESVETTHLTPEEKLRKVQQSGHYFEAVSDVTVAPRQREAIEEPRVRPTSPRIRHYVGIKDETFEDNLKRATILTTQQKSFIGQPETIVRDTETSSRRPRLPEVIALDEKVTTTTTEKVPAKRDVLVERVQLAHIRGDLPATRREREVEVRRPPQREQFEVFDKISHVSTTVIPMEARLERMEFEEKMSGYPEEQINYFPEFVPVSPVSRFEVVQAVVPVEHERFEVLDTITNSTRIVTPDRPVLPLRRPPAVHHHGDTSDREMVDFAETVERQFVPTDGKISHHVETVVRDVERPVRDVLVERVELAHIRSDLPRKDRERDFEDRQPQLERFDVSEKITHVPKTVIPREARLGQMEFEEKISYFPEFLPVTPVSRFEVAPQPVSEVTVDHRQREAVEEPCVRPGSQRIRHYIGIKDESFEDILDRSTMLTTQQKSFIVQQPETIVRDVIVMNENVTTTQTEKIPAKRDVLVERVQLAHVRGDLPAIGPEREAEVRQPQRERFEVSEKISHVPVTEIPMEARLERMELVEKISGYPEEQTSYFPEFVPVSPVSRFEVIQAVVPVEHERFNVLNTITNSSRIVTPERPALPLQRPPAVHHHGETSDRDIVGFAENVERRFVPTEEPLSHRTDVETVVRNVEKPVKRDVLVERVELAHIRSDLLAERAHDMIPLEARLERMEFEEKVSYFPEFFPISPISRFEVAPEVVMPVEQEYFDVEDITTVSPTVVLADRPVVPIRRLPLVHHHQDTSDRDIVDSVPSRTETHTVIRNMERPSISTMEESVIVTKTEPLIPKESPPKKKKGLFESLGITSKNTDKAVVPVPHMVDKPEFGRDRPSLILHRTGPTDADFLNLGRRRLSFVEHQKKPTPMTHMMEDEYSEIIHSQQPPIRPRSPDFETAIKTSKVRQPQRERFEVEETQTVIPIVVPAKEIHATTVARETLDESVVVTKTEKVPKERKLIESHVRDADQPRPEPAVLVAPLLRAGVVHHRTADSDREITGLAELIERRLPPPEETEVFVERMELAHVRSDLPPERRIEVPQPQLERFEVEGNTTCTPKTVAGIKPIVPLEARREQMEMVETERFFPTIIPAVEHECFEVLDTVVHSLDTVSPIAPVVPLRRAHVEHFELEGRIVYFPEVVFPDVPVIDETVVRTGASPPKREVLVERVELAHIRSDLPPTGRVIETVEIRQPVREYFELEGRIVHFPETIVPMEARREHMEFFENASFVPIIIPPVEHERLEKSAYSPETEFADPIQRRPSLEEHTVTRARPLTVEHYTGISDREVEFFGPERPIDTVEILNEQITVTTNDVAEPPLVPPRRGQRHPDHTIETVTTVREDWQPEAVDVLGEHIVLSEQDRLVQAEIFSTDYGRTPTIVHRGEEELDERVTRVRGPGIHHHTGVPDREPEIDMVRTKPILTTYISETDLAPKRRTSVPSKTGEAEQSQPYPWTATVAQPVPTPTVVREVETVQSVESEPRPSTSAAKRVSSASNSSEGSRTSETVTTTKQVSESPPSGKKKGGILGLFRSGKDKKEAKVEKRETKSEKKPPMITSSVTKTKVTPTSTPPPSRNVVVGQFEGPARHDEKGVSGVGFRKISDESFTSSTSTSETPRERNQKDSVAELIHGPRYVPVTETVVKSVPADEFVLGRDSLDIDTESPVARSDFPIYHHPGFPDRDVEGLALRHRPMILRAEEEPFSETVVRPVEREELRESSTTIGGYPAEEEIVKPSRQTLPSFIAFERSSVTRTSPRKPRTTEEKKRSRKAKGIGRSTPSPAPSGGSSELEVRSTGRSDISDDDRRSNLDYSESVETAVAPTLKYKEEHVTRSRPSSAAGDHPRTSEEYLHEEVIYTKPAHKKEKTEFVTFVHTGSRTHSPQPREYETIEPVTRERFVPEMATVVREEETIAFDRSIPIHHRVTSGDGELDSIVLHEESWERRAEQEKLARQALREPTKSQPTMESLDETLTTVRVPSTDDLSRIATQKEKVGLFEEELVPLERPVPVEHFVNVKDLDYESQFAKLELSRDFVDSSVTSVTAPHRIEEFIDTQTIVRRDEKVPHPRHLTDSEMEDLVATRLRRPMEYDERAKEYQPVLEQFQEDVRIDEVRHRKDSKPTEIATVVVAEKPKKEVSRAEESISGSVTKVTTTTPEATKKEKPKKGSLFGGFFKSSTKEKSESNSVTRSEEETVTHIREAQPEPVEVYEKPVVEEHIRASETDVREVLPEKPVVKPRVRKESPPPPLVRMEESVTVVPVINEVEREPLPRPGDVFHRANITDADIEFLNLRSQVDVPVVVRKPVREETVLQPPAVEIDEVELIDVHRPTETVVESETIAREVSEPVMVEQKSERKKPKGILGLFKRKDYSPEDVRDVPTEHVTLQHSSTREDFVDAPPPMYVREAAETVEFIPKETVEYLVPLTRPSPVLHHVGLTDDFITETYSRHLPKIPVLVSTPPKIMESFSESSEVQQVIDVKPEAPPRPAKVVQHEVIRERAEPMAPRVHEETVEHLVPLPRPSPVLHHTGVSDDFITETYFRHLPKTPVLVSTAPKTLESLSESLEVQKVIDVKPKPEVPVRPAKVVEHEFIRERAEPMVPRVIPEEFVREESAPFLTPLERPRQPIHRVGISDSSIVGYILVHQPPPVVRIAEEEKIHKPKAIIAEDESVTVTTVTSFPEEVVTPAPPLVMREASSDREMEDYLSEQRKLKKVVSFEEKPFIRRLSDESTTSESETVVRQETVKSVPVTEIHESTSIQSVKTTKPEKEKSKSKGFFGGLFKSSKKEKSETHEDGAVVESASTTVVRDVAPVEKVPVERIPVEKVERPVTPPRQRPHPVAHHTGISDFEMTEAAPADESEFETVVIEGKPQRVRKVHRVVESLDESTSVQAVSAEHAPPPVKKLFEPTVVQEAYIVEETSRFDPYTVIPPPIPRRPITHGITDRITTTTVARPRSPSFKEYLPVQESPAIVREVELVPRDRPRAVLHGDHMGDSEWERVFMRQASEPVDTMKLHADKAEKALKRPVEEYEHVTVVSTTTTAPEVSRVKEVTISEPTVVFGVSDRPKAVRDVATVESGTVVTSAKTVQPLEKEEFVSTREVVYTPKEPAKPKAGILKTSKTSVVVRDEPIEREEPQLLPERPRDRPGPILHCTGLSDDIVTEMLRSRPVLIESRSEPAVTVVAKKAARVEVVSSPSESESDESDVQVHRTRPVRATEVSSEEEFTRTHSERIHHVHLQEAPRKPSPVKEHLSESVERSYVEHWTSPLGEDISETRVREAPKIQATPFEEPVERARAVEPSLVPRARPEPVVHHVGIRDSENEIYRVVEPMEKPVVEHRTVERLATAKRPEMTTYRIDGESSSESSLEEFAESMRTVSEKPVKVRRVKHEKIPLSAMTSDSTRYRAPEAGGPKFHEDYSEDVEQITIVRPDHVKEKPESSVTRRTKFGVAAATPVAVAHVLEEKVTEKKKKSRLSRRDSATSSSSSSVEGSDHEGKVKTRKVKRPKETTQEFFAENILIREERERKERKEKKKDKAGVGTRVVTDHTARITVREGESASSSSESSADVHEGKHKIKKIKEPVIKAKVPKEVTEEHLDESIEVREEREKKEKLEKKKEKPAVAIRAVSDDVVKISVREGSSESFDRETKVKAAKPPKEPVEERLAESIESVTVREEREKLEKQRKRKSAVVVRAPSDEATEITVRDIEHERESKDLRESTPTSMSISTSEFMSPSSSRTGTPSGGIIKTKSIKTVKKKLSNEAPASTKTKEYVYEDVIYTKPAKGTKTPDLYQRSATISTTSRTQSPPPEVIRSASLAYGAVKTTETRRSPPETIVRHPTVELRETETVVRSVDEPSKVARQKIPKEKTFVKKQRSNHSSTSSSSREDAEEISSVTKSKLTSPTPEPRDEVQLVLAGMKSKETHPISERSEEHVTVVSVVPRSPEVSPTRYSPQPIEHRVQVGDLEFERMMQHTAIREFHEPHIIIASHLKTPYMHTIVPTHLGTLEETVVTTTTVEHLVKHRGRDRHEKATASSSGSSESDVDEHGHRFRRKKQRKPKVYEINESYEDVARRKRESDLGHLPAIHRDSDASVSLIERTTSKELPSYISFGTVEEPEYLHMRSAKFVDSENLDDPRSRPSWKNIRHRMGPKDDTTEYVEVRMPVIYAQSPIIEPEVETTRLQRSSPLPTETVVRSSNAGYESTSQVVKARPTITKVETAYERSKTASPSSESSVSITSHEQRTSPETWTTTEKATTSRSTTLPPTMVASLAPSRDRERSATVSPGFRATSVSPHPGSEFLEEHVAVRRVKFGAGFEDRRSKSPNVYRGNERFDETVITTHGGEVPRPVSSAAGSPAPMGLPYPHAYNIERATRRSPEMFSDSERFDTVSPLKSPQEEVLYSKPIRKRLIHTPDSVEEDIVVEDVTFKSPEVGNMEFWTTSGGSTSGLDDDRTTTVVEEVTRVRDVTKEESALENRASRVSDSPTYEEIPLNRSPQVRHKEEIVIAPRSAATLPAASTSVIKTSSEYHRSAETPAYAKVKKPGKETLEEDVFYWKIVNRRGKHAKSYSEERVRARSPENNLTNEELAVLARSISSMSGSFDDDHSNVRKQKSEKVTKTKRTKSATGVSSPGMDDSGMYSADGAREAYGGDLRMTSSLERGKKQDVSGSIGRRQKIVTTKASPQAKPKQMKLLTTEAQTTLKSRSFSPSSSEPLSGRTSPYDTARSSSVEYLDERSGQSGGSTPSIDKSSRIRKGLIADVESETMLRSVEDDVNMAYRTAMREPLPDRHSCLPAYNLLYTDVHEHLVELEGLILDPDCQHVDEDTLNSERQRFTALLDGLVRINKDLDRLDDLYRAMINVEPETSAWETETKQRELNRLYMDLLSQLKHILRRIKHLQMLLDEYKKRRLHFKIHLLEELTYFRTHENMSEEDQRIRVNRLLEEILQLRSATYNMFVRSTPDFAVRLEEELHEILMLLRTELRVSTDNSDDYGSIIQLLLTGRYSVEFDATEQKLILSSDEITSEIPTSTSRLSNPTVWSVLRRALPMQALALILLGFASLIPMTDDEFSCLFSNYFASSFNPALQFSGPPPI